MAAQPHHALILAVYVAVAGCASSQSVPEVRTVYVETPVPVQRTAPDELARLRDDLGPLPVFVAPDDPDATSALTPEGERRLRALVEQLLTGLEAWEAWAADDDE